MDPNFIPHMTPQQEVKLPEAVQLQPTDSKSGVAGIGTTPESMTRIVKSGRSRRMFWTATSTVLTVSLLALIGIVIANTQSANKAKQVQSASFANATIPLEDVTPEAILKLGQLGKVDFNGRVQVNGALVLTPQELPENAATGQLYYDSVSNQVYYYNGQEFRQITDTTNTVTNINGVSGAFRLGQGLTLANGVLSNSIDPASIAPLAGDGIEVNGRTVTNTGVLSIQGQAGVVNFITNDGIEIDGNIISNTGVTRLGNAIGNIAIGPGLTLNGNTLDAAGSTLTTNTPTELTITQTVNGWNIDKVGAGAGGTVALGPVAAQTDNSSNPSIAINKTTSADLLDLQVNGSSRFKVNNAGLITSGSIDYTQVNNRPLTVINSIAGVSGAITLDSSLVMTGNQLSVNISGGGLYIPNSATQSNANINIRSGNAGNPTAVFTGGIGSSVNVLEVYRNGTATPLFAVGAAGISYFQPSSNDPNAFSVRNTGGVGILSVDTTGNGIVNIGTTPGQTALNVTGDINVDSASSYKVNGVPICGQYGCLSASGGGGGAGILNSYVFDTTPVTGRFENIALYSQEDSQDTAAIRARTGQVLSGAMLLQFLDENGAKTLAVDTDGSIRYGAGADKTSLSFETPNNGVSINYVFKTGGTSRTEYVCTNLNNQCNGSGSGITGSGTLGTLPFFDTTSTLADSIVSQSANVLTVAGDIVVARANPTTTLTVGTSNTSQGILAFRPVNSAFGITLQPNATSNTLAGNVDLRLPTVAGTLVSSATGALSIDPDTGVISCNGCLTQNGGGGAAAVESIDGLQGVVTINNATGSGQSITIDNAVADGTTKGIAAFNSTNFSSLNGIINTAQAINATANPAFTSIILGRSVGDVNGAANGQVEFRNSVSTSQIFLTPATAANGTVTTLTLPAITGTVLAAVTAGSDLTASNGTLTLATIAPTRGGTGQTTYTQGDLLYASAANVLGKLAIAGSNGLCLVSNGSVPSWGNCTNGSGGGGAVTLGDAYTNYGSAAAVVNLSTSGSRNGILLQGSVSSGPLFAVQSTGGGSNYLSVTAADTTISNTLQLPNVANGILTVSGGTVSGGALNLSTANLSNTLPIARGGTNIGTYVTGDLLYASAANTLDRLAIGTAPTDVGKCLIISGSNLPTWGSCAGSPGSGVTLQSAYNNSGPAPTKIDLNNTNGGFIIRDNATPITVGSGKLFAVQNTGGSDFFNVNTSGATVTGTLTVNGTGSFTAVAGAFTGASTLTLGTTGSNNGSIIFRSSNGSSSTTTLQQTTAKNSVPRTITLPDADGVVCVDTGNCGVASGSGNYIQNQSVSAQSASFWLNSTGRSDVSFTAPLFDTATAAALNIGTNNATQINLNKPTFIASNTSFNAYGDSVLRPATNSTSALQVQNSSTTTVLRVDTSNSRVAIAMGGTLPSYPLDVTGDINSSTGYRINGTQICTSSGCTINPASGIQNTVSVQSNANFYIRSSATNQVAGRVEGITGQTADIFQVRGQGFGVAFFAVDKDGLLSMMNNTGSITQPALTVRNNTGTTTLQLRSGSSNIGIGLNTLQSVTGSSNIGLGNNLSVLTSGSDNIAIGTNALSATVNGAQNVAIGSNALQGNVSGQRSVAIGFQALIGGTGWDNVAIGRDSLGSNTGGSSFAIGALAGNMDNTWSQPTALSYAGAIGASAITQVSNSIVLGSVSQSIKVGIGTTIPLNTFSVSPLNYSTGTASQSGTTITGVGTTWTSSMVGMQFIFANAATATITGFTSATSLTASVSQTVSSQSYRIHSMGLQVANSTGNVGIGTASPSYDLSFGGFTGRTIRVETQTITNTAGASLTVQSATGNGNANGGALNLQAGNSGVSSGVGGAVNINAGTGALSGAGGAINLNGGAGSGSGGFRGDGGAISIQGGTGGAAGGIPGAGGAVIIKGGTVGSSGSSAGGGVVTIQGGDGNSSGAPAGAVNIVGGSGNLGGNSTGGNVNITGGTPGGICCGNTGGSVSITAASSSGQGGAVNITSGSSGNSFGAGSITLQAGTGGSSNGAGGNVTLTAGNAGAGNANGGTLTLQAGAKAGTGTGGQVIIRAAALSDDANFFRIQNSSSQAIVTVGTTTTSDALIVNNLTSTGAIFRAQDNGTDVLTVSDGGASLFRNSVNSTTAFRIQNAGGAATLLTVDTTNSLVVIGGVTNNATFNATNGDLTFNGTSRRAKKILMTAEYAGAVFDAGTGANNQGTLTAGLDLTNRKNYYKWVTTQATSQSYDVVVQVPIPSDFSAWNGSTPLSLDVYSEDLANGTIQLEMRSSTNTVETNVNFANVTPGLASTWQTITAGSVSGTYTAGDYLTLRIRMYSTNAVPAGGVRVGNVTLNYLSKW